MTAIDRPAAEERLLADFLAEWRAGRSPALEEFLARRAAPGDEVWIELLQADQEWRWLRGERPTAESYLVRFPRLRGNPELAMDLIFAEYMLRERFGDPPAPEDFLARYPQYSVELRRQIELHRALEGIAESADDVGDSPAPPAAPGYTILRELGREIGRAHV